MSQYTVHLIEALSRNDPQMVFEQEHDGGTIVLHHFGKLLQDKGEHAVEVQG